MSIAPTITVVTVCRNAAVTIEQTIRSVLSQSYANVEYIIIDGASTDDTLRIIDRYRHRIAHVVSEPDNGLYDAMNKGIALASGEWIHLLNADDYYAGDDVLERCMPMLREDAVNYCSIFRELNGVITDLFRFPYRGWKLYVSAKLPHPGLIVSRRQYQEMGLYDATLKIAADHDLILRMVKRYQPNFIDFPLTIMDQGGVSTTNLELSYREFMLVTIRQGLPAPIAWSIYWLKRLRWRV